ncbi:MAG: DEAD/DEAH box helicase [Candidatus Methanomethylicia archaeon]|nr:DEAD/DEAH box helicase [Candidatus Methanomethylicia archaeon]MCX8168831.1 DEAD/DEAH box helicase [Candidatus Methanomethylicia archaeon]MDW7988563.1 DEAD/DEAH box helicase [Nitrososphaerota archaeon]
MNSFQKLHSKLREIIEDYGYLEPTEPQELAIPEILNGRNILLIAPTGSGKTEAALFPVMSMILNGDLKGIKAIYITPLRALNRDIFRRMVEIANEIGLSIEVRHGDTPEAARKKQAIKPPQILITTPETLQAILPGRVMRKHLSKVEYVIVDELHELMSDKRGVQLSLALERLEEICGRNIQRIGLSATISSRLEAAKFLVGINRDVKIIDSTEEKKFEINVEVAMDYGEQENKLDLPIDLIVRLRKIIEISSGNRATLLFTNTRETAEALTTLIKKLNPPFKIGVHHSSLSREERLNIEEEFKNGLIKLLICTSSLELGIDIGSIDLVIQYTSPRQVMNLIQRVGRAGHKLWETSRGIIIASTIDDILESTVLARRGVIKEVELSKIHENALDVLAHQIVGLILDWGLIRVNDIKRIFSRTYPYRNLTEEEIVKVVSFLSEIKILNYFKEEGVIKAKKSRTWKYYYDNISMIPDIRKFKVISIEDRRPIGTLDEDFIVIHGKDPFILSGRTWSIVNVDEDELKVYVEYVGEELAAIPAWIGELIPVPMEVAMEATDLREKIVNGENLAKYPLNRELIDYVKGELKKHLDIGLPIPTSKRILIEGFGKINVIHIPLGTNGNRALAALLAFNIMEKLKMDVKIISDQYRVALITPRSINPEYVFEVLRKLNVKNDEFIKALKKTREYKWKIFHVARRMGVIEKDAKINRIESIIPILEDTVVEEEAIREALQDYFDIESLSRYLNKLKMGSVEIEICMRDLNKDISPLTKQVLMQLLPHGLIPKLEVPLNLMELIKNRLENKDVVLACIHCRKWIAKYKIKYLPDQLMCPKCGAKAIGTTYREDILKLLDKWFKGRKLNEEEVKDLENFRKSVTLVMSYGKKALITLAARGIGPTIALRILRESYKTEEEFYLKIIEAEKEYLRTRMFWGE